MTNGNGTTQRTYGDKDLKIGLRTLIADVNAETGVNVGDFTKLPVEPDFKIPDGDAVAYFAPRIAATGIKGFTLAKKNIAGIIADLARFLVEQTASQFKAVEQDALFTIALRYGSSLCFVKPENVKSFSAYLAIELELAKKYAAIAAAERKATNQMAFQGTYDDVKPFYDAVRVNTIAIVKILGAEGNTLHTVLAMPTTTLFFDQQAWNTLKAFDEPTRCAALLIALHTAQAKGWHAITRVEMYEIMAEIRGNRHLGLNPDGFTAAKALKAYAVALGNDPTAASITVKGSPSRVSQFLDGAIGEVRTTITARGETLVMQVEAEGEWPSNLHVDQPVTVGSDALQRAFGAPQQPGQSAGASA